MEESRRREVHAKSEDHIGSKVTVVSLRAAAIDHAKQGGLRIDIKHKYYVPLLEIY
jgi:hypothetical protein